MVLTTKNHSFAEVFYDLGRDEAGEELVAEFHGSARSATGGDVTVDGDEFCGIVGTGEVTLEAWIAGGLLAIEDAKVTQHHWSSADGSDESLACVLIEQCLAYALMLVEILGSRHTTRQHEHVGIAEVYIVKNSVSLDGDTMGCLHKFRTADAHRYYVHATTTQNVERGQRFDVFEAISKKFIYFCHTFFCNLKKMM